MFLKKTQFFTLKIDCKLSQQNRIVTRSREHQEELAKAQQRIAELEQQLKESSVSQALFCPFKKNSGPKKLQSNKPLEGHFEQKNSVCSSEFYGVDSLRLEKIGQKKPGSSSKSIWLQVENIVLRKLRI